MSCHTHYTDSFLVVLYKWATFLILWFLFNNANHLLSFKTNVSHRIEFHLELQLRCECSILGLISMADFLSLLSPASWSLGKPFCFQLGLVSFYLMGSPSSQVEVMASIFFALPRTLLATINFVLRLELWILEPSPKNLEAIKVNNI